ncbi:hypothetical protein Ancab_022156 [Ancistrocladus abbreviatus]
MASNKNCIIMGVNQWVMGRWVWELKWRRPLLECEESLIPKLMKYLPKVHLDEKSQDKWHWLEEKSRKYTNRVLSKDMLAKRGLLPDDSSRLCVMCCVVEESCDHHFIHCEKAWEMWVGCFNWWAIDFALGKGCYDSLVQHQWGGFKGVGGKAWGGGLVHNCLDNMASQDCIFCNGDSSSSSLLDLIQNKSSF